MSQINDRVVCALKTICGNVGEGWFVILEEPESEKFVQFAFDQGEGLVFDCPTMAFDEEEMSRATRVMERFGISSGDLGTNGQISSFSADIGMNIELGAQIVAAMFREVFLFPDTVVFNIEINN